MSILNDEIEELLISRGAGIVKFADLREIPSEMRSDLPVGISIAVALDPDIIAGIRNGPNHAYYQEYQRINHLLDYLGREASEFLSKKGYLATGYSATNSGIDSKTLSTRLPHKTVATQAGLGWIGKSALLVTREFGPAIRITTVLTNAELETGDKTTISECGRCNTCVDACPGNAITGNDWQIGRPRGFLYNPFTCREITRKFEREREGVRNNICGICIAVCPWTQKYINRSR